VLKVDTKQPKTTKLSLYLTSLVCVRARAHACVGACITINSSIPTFAAVYISIFVATVANTITISTISIRVIRHLVNRFSLY